MIVLLVLLIKKTSYLHTPITIDTLYTSNWVNLLISKYGSADSQSVCNSCMPTINDKCIISQCSKFNQINLFRNVLNSIDQTKENYKILILMFNVFSDWESFIAFNGKLMETYCKNCIPYRDPITSPIPNTSFASITSTIGDVV